MHDTDNPQPAAPPTELRFFAYAHLPPHLRDVSAGFHALALDIVQRLPDCDQRKLALQCLLQAKDAAVRAALPKD